MKALILRGPGDVRLEERPRPEPGPGELRVRVAAAGLCGSDMQVIAAGRGSLPPPLQLGHEFGGTLDDGRFVVVNPMVGCGACRECDRGWTHLCAQRSIIGFRRPGAFGEEVVVPRRNVIDAAGLSPLRAALVEPIATALHAFHRAGRPEGRVAVIGCGSIGMSLLHVLSRRGVTHVTAIDPLAERREHARRAGAHEVGGELEGTFDAVFDCAGTRGTRETALSHTAPGGTVALVGLHDDVLAVSAGAVVMGDRTLTGCFAYSEAEFIEAAALAESIEAPWVELVPIELADKAVADVLAQRAPRERIKAVFSFMQT